MGAEEAMEVCSASHNQVILQTSFHTLALCSYVQRRRRQNFGKILGSKKGPEMMVWGFGGGFFQFHHAWRVTRGVKKKGRCELAGSLYLLASGVPSTTTTDKASHCGGGYIPPPLVLATPKYWESAVDAGGVMVTPCHGPATSQGGGGMWEVLTEWYLGMGLWSGTLIVFNTYCGPGTAEEVLGG